MACIETGKGKPYIDIILSHAVCILGPLFGKLDVILEHIDIACEEPYLGGIGIQGGSFCHKVEGIIDAADGQIHLDHVYDSCLAWLAIR